MKGVNTDKRYRGTRGAMSWRVAVLTLPRTRRREFFPWCANVRGGKESHGLSTPRMEWTRKRRLPTHFHLLACEVPREEKYSAQTGGKRNLTGRVGLPATLLGTSEVTGVNLSFRSGQRASLPWAGSTTQSQTFPQSFCLHRLVIPSHTWISTHHEPSIEAEVHDGFQRC